MGNSPLLSGMPYNVSLLNLMILVWVDEWGRWRAIQVIPDADARLLSASEGTVGDARLADADAIDGLYQR